MEEDDRRTAFISSYKQHRKGWGRSNKGFTGNSNSLNSNASSLWSFDSSSAATETCLEPCSHFECHSQNFDAKFGNPTIIIESPDIHNNYLTSSSSFVSSSPISNDRMTSSHDNGPSSDTSTPDENLGTFPLNLRSEAKFVEVRKSSDDEEVESSIERNLRHRRKSSPRRNAGKRKHASSNAPVTCFSSPYPSSVTSSLRHSSTCDTLSESDKIGSNTGVADDVFNHNFDEARKFEIGRTNLMMTSLEEEDVIVELPHQETKEYSNDVTSCGCCETTFPPVIPDAYKLVFNVCGKIFEVDSRSLEKFPDTLLGNPEKRMRCYDWRAREFFLDRHRDTFQVILDFYNNGGVLRRPDDIPIDIFINEVKFYAFDRDTLEKFLRDEGILHVPKQKAAPEHKLKKFIWNLFEDHEGACLSQLVTCISALVITVSVVVFCLETLDGFKSLNHEVDNYTVPALNACETYSVEILKPASVFYHEDRFWQPHVKFRRSSGSIDDPIATEKSHESGVPVLERYSLAQVVEASKSLLKECEEKLNLPHKYALARCLVLINDEEARLGQVYGQATLPASALPTTPVADEPVTSQPHRLRHKQQETKGEVRPTAVPESLTSSSKTTEAVTVATWKDVSRDQVFLILKQACPVLEDISTKTPYEWFILEARMGSAAGILFLTETCCIVWFVLELGLRFLCCPDKKKFAKSFLNMIDFLAILPYFITLIVTTIETKTHVRPQTATILRTIRLVRMLRILKLSRYSRGFRILGLTLVRSTRVLFLLVCFQVVLAILFSSIAYFVEYDAPKTQFKSIPDSFWWALITMTTVGYGDVTPITVWGKITGACCAVMGILCISFPVPVVVSNFNYLYNLDKAKVKLVPEDLMADEEEIRADNLDKFKDNLFNVLKRSGSGLTDEANPSQNPAELWNVARRHYRKMSLVSIDARLERSPSRSLTPQSSPIKIATIAESRDEGRKTSVKATTV